MDIDDIQPIVIYINDERRRHMEEELKDFPFSTMFFKGYTPNESAPYINYKHPVYPELDTTICCLRSHIGALKHYLENSTKSLALIFEDDVLLSKEFFPKLERILKLWQTNESEIDYVSIGYRPGQYSHKKSQDELCWDVFCEGGSIWGCQAYVVKRSVVEDMVRYLDTPTVSGIYEGMYRKLLANKCTYSMKAVRAQSDVVMSVGWRQAFIKPMLVIESPLFDSTISSSNANVNGGDWKKAFQSGELKVCDFAPCCDLYMK
jgi:hypothetical protein